MERGGQQPPSEREGDHKVVEGACDTFPFPLVYNKRYPHCCALSLTRLRGSSLSEGAKKSAKPHCLRKRHCATRAVEDVGPYNKCGK